MMIETRLNHTRGCTSSYTEQTINAKSLYQIPVGGFPDSLVSFVARYTMFDPAFARRIVPAKDERERLDLGHTGHSKLKRRYGPNNMPPHSRNTRPRTAALQTGQWGPFSWRRRNKATQAR